MTSKKNLGIWMDHSIAHVMDLTNENITSSFIDSVNLHSEKQHSLGTSESQTHNKDQRNLSAYYHKLIDEVKKYDNVILFGPTDAKVELFNLIRKENKYENIKIDVKNSDKMTDNQQQAFVKDHFANK